MYFHEKFTFHLKNGIAVVMFSWLVPTTTVRYLNTIATEEINHDLLLFPFTKHFFSKWSTINELRTYSILENRMLMTLWEYKIVLLIISIFTKLFIKVLTYFQEAERRGANVTSNITETVFITTITNWTRTLISTLAKVHFRLFIRKSLFEC